MNTYFMKQENFFKEIIKFTLIALVIVIPVRTFIAQPFVVSGVSMDPNFKTADYLIIDELSYRFNEPKREDVIVMRYPRDPSTFFIKRIIGLPLDTVSVKNGIITIYNKENPNGFIVESKYVSDTHKSNETFSVSLEKTEYFVMGDNRKESMDSRSWGPLPSKDIVGRPLVRLFPFNKINLFPGLENIGTTTKNTK